MALNKIKVNDTTTVNTGVVYDITKATGLSYDSLSAALGTDGNNVPSEVREGGMSIRFVLTSDNKYVQYRYMETYYTTATFTNVTNWQGVDIRVTGFSDNLITSNAVSTVITFFRAIGNNNTAAGEWKYRVKKGNYYRIYIKTKDIDMSGVTYLGYRFLISSRDSNDILVEELIRVNVGTDLKDYYDFQPTQDVDHLWIGIRATTGAEFIAYMEDITDSKNELIPNTQIGSESAVKSWGLYFNMLGFKEVHNGWMGLSANVNQFSIGYHAVIPVSSGQKVVISKPQQNTNYVIAFLNSYTVPTENGQLYDLNGTRILDSGYLNEYIVPENATYLWVGLYQQDGEATPSYLSVDDNIITFKSRKEIENVIGEVFSMKPIDIPISLEQGSLTSVGEKEEPYISPNRVRAAYLIQVNGQFTFHIQSGFQYSINYYSENDWTTRVKFNPYTSEDTTDEWIGYIGFVIKRNDGTSISPSDPDITLTKPSFAYRINELSISTKKTIKNVKDYGAVGDGVTDDTNVFVNVLQSGGHIYVPDGTYLISSKLQLYSNTHLELSSGATIKRNANINALFFSHYEETTTAYNGQTGITIEGGILDMGEGFTQGGFQLGLTHCENIQIKNVTFRHNNVGYHCIDACGVKNLKVINCTFKDTLVNSQYGELIQIDSPQLYSSFPMLYNGNYACWDNTPCVDVEIYGCIFELNTYSPAIGNHSAGAHKRINIHDNTIIGSGIDSQNNRGAFTFGISSGYTSDNITDLVNIHDNIVINCKYGFEILTPNTFVVKNNIFRNIQTLKTASSGENGVFESNVIES